MYVCRDILESYNLDAELIMWHLSCLASNQERVRIAYNLIEQAIYCYAWQLKNKGKQLVSEMYKYLSADQLKWHKYAISDYTKKDLLCDAMKWQNQEVKLHPEQYVDLETYKKNSQIHRYSNLFQLFKESLELYYEFL